jgi:hypothetical protein
MLDDQIMIGRSFCQKFTQHWHQSRSNMTGYQEMKVATDVV